MPKHVALGIAVRHTNRSKQLFTMFSRMGPCSSYDDIEAMDTSTANDIIANSDIIGVVLPSNISTCVFEQVAADNNDNMKTLLTVTGQHWSFFFRNRWLPMFSTVYTFRKNVHYTMALLGQNSVGEPSIMGQFPMFVRTGTHERTTALKPLHPGTLCFSERKRSTPNNFNGGILANAQVRSIMQASVTFEPWTRHVSVQRNKYPNSWMLSI